MHEASCAPVTILSHLNVLAAVLQLQSSIAQAVSQVLAASLQGYGAQLTSDTITLGGSEPDMSR